MARARRCAQGTLSVVVWKGDGWTTVKITGRIHGHSCT